MSAYNSGQSVTRGTAGAAGGPAAAGAGQGGRVPSSGLPSGSLPSGHLPGDDGAAAAGALCFPAVFCM